MNETILIADLTHTGSKSYSPNLMPYPIGCIKSYLLEYSKYSSKLSIEIFKDPQKFIDQEMKNSHQINILMHFLEKNQRKLVLVIMFGILNYQ